MCEICSNLTIKIPERRQLGNFKKDKQFSAFFGNKFFFYTLRGLTLAKKYFNKIKNGRA